MLLSINTTPAQIEVKTHLGGLNWKTREAKLDMRQKQPLIKIKTEQPLILIDQYQCFAESGLKNNTDFMLEQAQKGKQSIAEYTGKVAQNGDAMAKIGHKANIMINIAKQSAFTRHEFGLGTMPKSRPKINVTGGTVELKADYINNVGEINGVSSNYTAADIKFNYTPTVVDIKMVSYGSIDIKYLGNNVDGYV